MTHPTTFNVAIRTCARTPDYLYETVANLRRAGVFDSKHLGACVVLANDLSTRPAWLPDSILWITGKFTANEGAIQLMEDSHKLGGSTHTLMLEDDIDVCADFLESTALWLRDCASPGYWMYPLCANYNKVRTSPGIAWQYPRAKFYGTQAFVVRTEDIPQIVPACRARLVQYPRNGFDLILSICDMPGNFFLTPVPSFVQHIGETSSIHPGRFHSYGSWLGRLWSYVKRSSAFNPSEQLHQRFSPKLAEYLAAFFTDCGPVVDFGCSQGRYVEALNDADIKCLGVDATPGIAELTSAKYRHMIFEGDLTRPLTFLRGLVNSVLCLEVAEHIHPEHETDFLDNISTHAEKRLALSWAVPGQGGRRHVNERDADYVKNALADRGFLYLDAETRMARELGGSDLKWFKNSIYLFNRL